MARVFRVMKEEGGRPKAGTSGMMLGVRPLKDITPDAQDNVHAKSGGMSVFVSLRAMPAWIVPKRLERFVPGASGGNSSKIWESGSGPFVTGSVAPDLWLTVDEKKESKHGVIEPDRIMSLTEYQTALLATRETWSLCEEEQNEPPIR